MLLKKQNLCLLNMIYNLVKVKQFLERGHILKQLIKLRN